MAFFYATGYKGVVEIDQAKALLYYTFSANGGNQGSQMALGFRYWTGIGVNDDCLTALHWYETAAEHCEFRTPGSTSISILHRELQQWRSSCLDLPEVGLCP